MGKVCPPDYYKARALFSLAARKGHTGAQLRIDVMCLDAEEASRNYERTVTGTTVTTGEIDREGAKMTTQFERTHGQDDVRGNAAALVYGAETENTQLKMAQVHDERKGSNSSHDQQQSLRSSGGWSSGKDVKCRRR